jgi:hypothetical protein
MNQLLRAIVDDDRWAVKEFISFGASLELKNGRGQSGGHEEGTNQAA